LKEVSKLAQRLYQTAPKGGAMVTNRTDPRHEGYKAGGFFGGCCPYPSGSEEASDWERGWKEGMVRRAQTQRSNQHPPARWQKLLTKLRILVPLPQ
jgi:ribosome modulation factor